MKTICYVDGYNLFYGCLKHTNDKWLDLHDLLLKQIVHPQTPNAEIVKIKFFTADIRSKVATRGDLSLNAQQTYHRALLQKYPDTIEIIKGYYSLEKANLLAYQQPPDKTNRHAVWKLEEKQTDVNIALTAYRDAASNIAEQLVFVSNDTDLEPALAAIRQDFGNCHQIGVILPIRLPKEGEKKRPGNQKLSNYANWTRHHITDDELAASHLPNQIATAKKPIIKPNFW